MFVSTFEGAKYQSINQLLREISSYSNELSNVFFICKRLCIIIYNSGMGLSLNHFFLFCFLNFFNLNYYTSVYIFYIKLNADKITILHIKIQLLILFK